MDEVINEIFRNYCSDVLKDILPYQQVSDISSSSNAIDGIHLNNRNEAFIGSDYYEPVLNKKFIHFTSLEKFTSILLERSLRLYDLNYVDDKNEILFPFEYCDLITPFFERDRIYDLRRNILSFSFCDEEMDETTEYNMWRLYGNDGNGIAIQFSFEIDEKNWDSFHLSKIYYNNEKILSKIKIAYSKFNQYINKLVKDYNYQQGNGYYLFLNHILSLLAFHKVQIYNSENEYRLIYNIPDLPQPETRPFYIEKNKVVNKGKTVSKYFKVPIAQNNYTANELIPLIRIEEIVFGYRYNEEDFNVLKESLKEIMVYNSIKGRLFKITDLKRKYFT